MWLRQHIELEYVPSWNFVISILSYSQSIVSGWTQLRYSLMKYSNKCSISTSDRTEDVLTLVEYASHIGRHRHRSLLVLAADHTAILRIFRHYCCQEISEHCRIDWLLIEPAQHPHIGSPSVLLRWVKSSEKTAFLDTIIRELPGISGLSG